MAILPDFSQYYGQGGGLLGDLPQWLTEQGNTSVAPPRVSQGFAGVPEWFSAIKSGFDNNQGVVVPPGRFPTLSSGQQGDAELPPNPPPAMRPPPSADGYYGGSPETNPLLNPARYGNYPAPKPAPAPTFGSMAGEVGNRLLGAMNGFANAGSLPQALANGITTLATGRPTDPRAISQQNTMAQYKALVDAGIPAQQARLAIMNPEAMKAIVAAMMPKSEFHNVDNSMVASNPYQPGVPQSQKMPADNFSDRFNGPNLARPGAPGYNVKPPLGGPPAPPAAAVKALRDNLMRNPQLKADFIAKYGQKAFDQAMGGR